MKGGREWYYQWFLIYLGYFVAKKEIKWDVFIKKIREVIDAYWFEGYGPQVPFCAHTYKQIWSST